MKRKIIALLLALVLLPAAALAQAVPRAAQPLALKQIQDRLGFKLDEASGEWSLGADEFATLLESARKSGNSGFCVFQVQLEGNARTGLMQPMLDLYYVGSKEILPGAVSLLADGVRYDLLAASEEVKLGEERRAERVRCPLTAEGLDALRAVQRADSFRLLLLGDRAYETKIENGYAGGNAKRKMEAGSLHCLGLLGELDALGLEDYELWDLNAARWRAKYDFAPAAQKVQVGGDDFGLLKAGDSGAKVRALQKLLIAGWFLPGSADGSYGAQTREAVVKAQKKYGLLPTGGADERLTACLESDAPPEAPKAAADPGELQALGAAARLRIDRHWSAQRVLPSQAAGDMAAYAASNLDNVLIICEGELQNAGADQLDLSYDFKGTVTLDGYEYPCAFLCERDAGAAFDAKLLPQARSRLIVAAEVPVQALSAADGALQIQCGGAELKFELA